MFSGRALSFLEASDPDSYADIERRLETWDNQTIVHHDQVVRIDGYGFSGVTRIDLLTILQDHCRRRGVQLHFNTRLTDLSVFDDCDLIVGADGANSVVRQIYAEHFQPKRSRRFQIRTSGTAQHSASTRSRSPFARTPMEPLSRITIATRPTAAPSSWSATRAPGSGAGFARMDEEQSRRYCEQLFAPELSGHPLLTNRSNWLNFRAVTNQYWQHNNVVLLGDTLRTVHFSIGSGTRMALEDAIALHRAFQYHDEVIPALRAFETAHRPAVEQFLKVAQASYTWYEHFHEKMQHAPLDLAYDYMTRSGVDAAKLRQRAPGFMAAYDAHVGSAADGGYPWIRSRLRSPSATTPARSCSTTSRRDAATRSPSTAAIRPSHTLSCARPRSRVGNALGHLGLPPGARIFQLLLDTPAFPAAFFGAVRAGHVPIVNNTALTLDDYTYFLQDSAAPVAIVDASLYPQIAAIRASCPELRHVIVVGEAAQDTIAWEQWLAYASPELELSRHAQGRPGLLDVQLRQHGLSPKASSTSTTTFPIPSPATPGMF